MTEEKKSVGLSKEEQERIAQTVAGLNKKKGGRRKSILDPPDEEREVEARVVAGIDLAAEEEAEAPSAEPDDLELGDSGVFEADDDPDDPGDPDEEDVDAGDDSGEQDVESEYEDSETMFDLDDAEDPDNKEEKPKAKPKAKPKGAAPKKPVKPEKEEGEVETSEERGSMTVRVFCRYKDKYHLVKDECIPLTKTETDGTKAKTGIGFTLNMGDMQFCRLDVGLELPTTIDDIPEAYAACWKITQGELMNQIDEMKRSEMYKKGDD